RYVSVQRPDAEPCGDGASRQPDADGGPHDFVDVQSHGFIQSRGAGQDDAERNDQHGGGVRERQDDAGGTAASFQQDGGEGGQQQDDPHAVVLKKDFG